MTGRYRCACTAGKGHKKARKKGGKRKHGKKRVKGCKHPRKYSKCVRTQMRAYMSKKKAKSKCAKAYC